MAASVKRRKSEDGQSIIEFMLMLPVMLGLTIVLLRVNEAIQVSIVNQRYSREMAHFLTFNSPYYPEKKFHESEFHNKKYNQMVIGVSQNYADDEEGGAYVPEAATQMIARSKALSGGAGPDQAEVEKRGIVRIRTTVAMCTPSYVVKGPEGDLIPLTPNGMQDGTDFSYCRSPQDE